MSQQTDNAKVLLDEAVEEFVQPVKRFPSDYANGVFAGSAMEDEAFRGEDSLYGDRVPSHEIRREQPQHRQMILMKAAGFSNKEIAEKLGYAQTTISQILRQPWARMRLLEEMKAAGRDTLQGLLASTAEDSVWTLIEIRDKADAKNSDRIVASNSLLDRYLGKPNQPISHTGLADPSKMTDEELAKVIVSKDGTASGNI